MTSRQTWPRSQASHEREANAILTRYAVSQGWTPGLPVPIDNIVEGYFGLTIVWEALEEPPGQMILGALSPQDRSIRLNERHISLFEGCVGPEAFTLAHELGHWIYDAVDPAQSQLFTISGHGVVFCRQVSGDEQQGSWDIREINANKFAACLLLPSEPMRQQIRSPFGSSRSFATCARTWGVSQTTLKIRLQSLDLDWALP